jgi:PAS domain S-box-containing protein
MAAMAYIEVRRSAVAVAAQRLNGQARQLADLLEVSAVQRHEFVRVLASRPSLAGYLEQATDSLAGPVLDSLQAYADRTGPIPSMELWNREGGRVLVWGDTFPAFPPEASAALIELVLEAGSAIGPFVGDDSLEYAAIGRVGGAANPLGYVLERRPVAASADAVRQLRGLMGEAQIVIGSPGLSDNWTDFVTRVSPPPIVVAGAAGVFQYTRSPGEPAIAWATPIGSTPWVLLAELPSGPVLAPARRFLLRAGTLSIVLVLVGGLLGWTTSRQITGPLQGVTAAAERIAAGDASSRVAVVRSAGVRSDEIGRLAVSFNTMADRIDEMQADLRRLVRHYRPLFERNPLPMWLAEPASGQILEANEAAIAHYGYSREAFLGMAAQDFTIQSDQVGPAMTLDRHRCADGRTIDVEVTRHQLRENGQRVLLVLANDVSVRIEAERALQEFNEELERRVAERTAELATANGELEAFSYSVSHDLRAPLRAINGFSEILIEDHAPVLPDEARETLGVIAANAQKMGQLIDDLLHLARLAREPLVRVRTDMTDMARTVVVEAQAREPHRQLEFEIEPLPPVDVEPALVRQVFVNLVQNAVKFSTGTNPTSIHIGHRRDGGESIYFVRDNGIGFDMQYADKLFGVFQRLHGAEEFDGTGVGLAIVDRIIRRHGGRVWAESRIGAGATFFFTLSAKQATM